MPTIVWNSTLMVDCMDLVCTLFVVDVEFEYVSKGFMGPKTLVDQKWWDRIDKMILMWKVYEMFHS